MKDYKILFNPIAAYLSSMTDPKYNLEREKLEYLDYVFRGHYFCKEAINIITEKDTNIYRGAISIFILTQGLETYIKGIIKLHKEKSNEDFTNIEDFNKKINSHKLCDLAEIIIAIYNNHYFDDIRDKITSITEELQNMVNSLEHKGEDRERKKNERPGAYLRNLNGTFSYNIQEDYTIYVLYIDKISSFLSTLYFLSLNKIYEDDMNIKFLLDYMINDNHPNKLLHIEKDIFRESLKIIINNRGES